MSCWEGISYGGSEEYLIGVTFTIGQDFNTQAVISSGLLEAEHLLLVIPSRVLQMTFLRFIPSPQVTEH